MVRILLKKQLSEIFRSYLYNAKKNTKRSTGGIIAMFALFAFLMIGVMGGIYTGMAILLGDGLIPLGMAWLYFLIMSGVAILFGALGSVFSTYSGLYLAKDNDQLLSMPVPVRTILVSRLLGVYLMGLLYLSTAAVPAVVVYLVIGGFSVTKQLCGIGLIVILSAIVMILSCLLGWCVAKISRKLKNKSFVTVLLSLLFIGAYYFFYFRASEMIRDLIAHAQEYGESIRGKAYVLYQFGSIGDGNVGVMLICLAICALLLAGTFLVLGKTFLSIATASGTTAKVRYRERAARQQGLFPALLKKEFAHFVAKPSYMLNCGLGVLLIPACGVLLLIKGGEVISTIEILLSDYPGCINVFICAVLCMLAVMNDMAAPSVSLEGKQIWVLQSMPVKGETVLLAKASAQLILTAVPLLFASICAACVCPGGYAEKVFIIILPLLFAVLSALFNTFLSVKMANLNWTNEIVPIKQSACVTVALFGSWVYPIALGGLYILFAYSLGAVLYLALASLITLILSGLLGLWIYRKGGKVFMELH